MVVPIVQQKTHETVPRQPGSANRGWLPDQAEPCVLGGCRHDGLFRRPRMHASADLPGRQKRPAQPHQNRGGRAHAGAVGFQLSLREVRSGCHPKIISVFCSLSFRPRLCVADWTSCNLDNSSRTAGAREVPVSRTLYGWACLFCLRHLPPCCFLKRKPPELKSGAALTS